MEIVQTPTFHSSDPGGERDGVFPKATCSVEKAPVETCLPAVYTRTVRPAPHLCHSGP